MSLIGCIDAMNLSIGAKSRLQWAEFFNSLGIRYPNQVYHLLGICRDEL